MSVTVESDCIRLSGRCLAEDAEALLVALQEHPGLGVDIGEVRKLHLAVLQVLLAARPRVTGTPDNAFLAAHVVDLLQ
jgi:hypothetical protein